MANFPIENMVILTYNIIEVIYVAELCLECLNKLTGRNEKKSTYILSKDLDLCDNCGEWKRVVVMTKRAYYKRKYKWIFSFLKGVKYSILVFIRLVIFPFWYFWNKIRK